MFESPKAFAERVPREISQCDFNSRIAKDHLRSAVSLRDAALAISVLKNSGIDTGCASCMSVAFTGVTTAPHTCKRVSNG